MTQRERVLVTGMAGALVVLGGGLVFHMFVWQPLGDVWERLDAARASLAEKKAELAKEQQQIDTILRVDPRLAHWKKLSLPPMDPALKKKKGLTLEERKGRHQNQLQIKYEKYLSELLVRNGFAADTVVITPRPPERRFKPRGGKDTGPPPQERLTFYVTGRAPFNSVVKMLDEFHRTNLLHQVRGLTLAVVETPAGGAPRGGIAVNRGGRGGFPNFGGGMAFRGGFGNRGGGGGGVGPLNLTMTVDALVVRGAEERSTLLPKGLKAKPRVLAEPGRRYADMAVKNMFTGTPASAPVQKEDRAEVLRFVRLTTLFYNGRRWEASLYDQAKGGDEQKVNAVTLTEFAIYDRFNNQVLTGEVVYIDEEQMVFKAEGRHYSMKCGDFLYPAVTKPMTPAELEKLGISPGGT
jgi:hypothetical protein